MELASQLAVTGLSMLEPGDEKGLQFRIRRVIVAAAHQRLPHHKGGAALRQTRTLHVGAVNVGVSPDVAHATENRVVLLLGNDDPARGVSVPLAMVTQECPTQDILTPADLVAVDLVETVGRRINLTILHSQLRPAPDFQPRNRAGKTLFPEIWGRMSSGRG